MTWVPTPAIRWVRRNFLDPGHYWLEQKHAWDNGYDGPDFRQTKWIKVPMVMIDDAPD